MCVRVNWKRIFLSMMLSVALLMPTVNSVPVEAANTRLDIFVDGQKLWFDVPAQIDGERALAPMRTVFEGIGADVRWEASTRTAVATKDGVTIRLPIGSKQVTKNGQPVTLDVPAKLVNSRTMVPVRFISEAFGNNVSWNSALRQVFVRSAKQPQVRIVGADTSVTDAQLLETKQLMAGGLLQRVEQEAGLKFKQPVWIFVTNSDKGYEQAIRWYGEDAQAKMVADESMGVTYGSKVVMPKQRNPLAVEYKSTIAHELIHVLLNQNGGEELPSWVHEGMAWETGINLGYQNEPIVMKKQMLGLNRSEVLYAVEMGHYVPLINGIDEQWDEQNAATYNIQAQDHMAYRYIIDKYGREAFMSYLTTYMKGDHAAFSKVLGLTPQQFEQQFYQYLQSELQKTSQGVELRLQITDTNSSDLGVLPQAQSIWQLFQLEPGTHTIRIYNNGRVEGITVDETWDDEEEPVAGWIYLALDAEQPQKQHGITAIRGGLVLQDVYGDYILNNIWLTPATGEDIYPPTNKFFGLEVVDVKSIH